MSDCTRTIDTYLEAYSETDAARRLALIEEVWAVDGQLIDPHLWPRPVMKRSATWPRPCRISSQATAYDPPTSTHITASGATPGSLSPATEL